MLENQDEIYKSIIGPKNQTYYLTKFTHFDDKGGVSASWHWPAFFVTFFWLLYRKMWANAFLYMFFSYILSKIVDVVTADNPTAIVIGNAIYFLALFLFPAMYASAAYYNHCKEKIKELSVSEQGSENLLKVISEKGGISKAALIFAIIYIICMIGIVVAIAIPAYQDYLFRAHNS